MTIKGVQKLIKDHGVNHVRQLAGQLIETFGGFCAGGGQCRARRIVGGATAHAHRGAPKAVKCARDLLAEQDS